MLGYVKLRNTSQLSFASDQISYLSNRLTLLSSPGLCTLTSGEVSIFAQGVFTRIGAQVALPGSDFGPQLLELYEKYGDEFYKHCDGLFFIILEDKKANKILLMNNRYQTSTLYFTTDDENLYFSSSLRSLIDHFVPNPQPHLGSIRSFVSTGFTIPDQTQIKGVKKLLPTFRLQVTESEVNLFNHWDEEFTFERKKSIDLEPELDRYEEIYRKGLSQYLENAGTTNLGCLLSGGHDTSFALIQASKVYDKEIHTFTTTFPDWLWNEEDYARNIANKFKAKFHSVPFLPTDVDLILDVISATEEPVVSVTIPMMKMARYAKDYVDTIIGGDGGDTLWGEYYPVEEYQRYVKNLPIWGRKFIQKVAQIGIKLTDWERFWELEHVASLFSVENYNDDFLRRLCTYRHFNDRLIGEVFKPEISQAEMPRSCKEIKFEKDNFHRALIEGKLFNGFYTYMSFFTHKEMESQGLKLYFPTINKDLMDFITTLPREWINGGTTFHRLTNHKAINRRFHKRALARYLKSEEIYNRSFDIPWYLILKPRKKMLDLLLVKLKKRGWYKDEAIEIMFKEFENQKAKDFELLELKHHGYRIYTLLALEVWAMQFLDGKKVENRTLEEYLA